MQPRIPVEQKLITPDERLDYIPFPPAAASFPLGWSGLRAGHFRMTLNHELHFPPMAQHLLILYQRPPDEMSLRNEDLILNAPPPPGSVAIIPAGSSTRGFWRGSSHATHVQLDPQLIARVAVEACDLDPARVELPTVYDLSHPQLQAAILALDAELATGGAGGQLLAESLGNVLAVHLVRHATGNGRAAAHPRGGLPTHKLRAALE
jgi:AraC family transcriptional regulator